MKEVSVFFFTDQLNIYRKNGSRACMKVVEKVLGSEAIWKHTPDLIQV